MTRHTLRRTTLASALVLGLVLASCTSSDDDDAQPPDTTTAPTATYVVAPGVEQLLVSDAPPDTELTVVDAEDAVLEKVTSDENGSALVRDLPPGEGYRVLASDDGEEVSSAATEVWGVDDVPDASFYEDQELVDGFQYLEARDGTLLAVNVTLPGPIEDGPYPTVLEYSGYDPANPESLQPLQSLANLLGYASVGVNMRGTGCSGGSFLFFEPAQWTDGYDAIETIAAQDWVAGGVGMVGISYPGISQLFVAQTNPPNLAAITPLSVIDDTYRSTLYPGGILNNGFATEWAEGRQADGAAFGQGWTTDQVEAGDTTCEDNQALRTQNPDLFEFIAEAAYVPEDRSTYVGRLAPSEWVDEIDVPVFLAGAWQDEQTGGHFPAMLDRFTGAPVTRFVMTNGGHTDALGPEVLLALSEFLDLYVAERVPSLPDGIDAALGLLGDAIFETAVELPAQRFTDVADLAEALERYESEPPVRILFENGAGGAPGAPVPAFDATFSAWPIPEVVPTTWHLGDDGALVPDAGDEGADAYDYDTSRAQAVTLDEGNPWAALPDWSWEGPAEGTAVAYATEPLDATLVMAGHGRVDLWVGADAPDVDLQVTLSEVRPDGTEVFVQNGWLRASHRQLDPERTTDLQPYHTHLEADAAPLPEGELTEVNVELFPFAHVFRAGSQVRLSIEGPGGTRPEWRFEALDAADGTNVTIGRGGATPSRVVLPVVPDIEAPAAAPPCPSLRGQPCRPLTSIANRAG
ncbi:MAG: CocE/NonD family hydrolase [Acidimicrobiales bacterium]